MGRFPVTLALAASACALLGGLFAGPSTAVAPVEIFAPGSPPWAPPAGLPAGAGGGPCPVEHFAPGPPPLAPPVGLPAGAGGGPCPVEHFAPGPPPFAPPGGLPAGPGGEFPPVEHFAPGPPPSGPPAARLAGASGDLPAPGLLPLCVALTRSLALPVAFVAIAVLRGRAGALLRPAPAAALWHLAARGGGGVGGVAAVVAVSLVVSRVHLPVRACRGFSAVCAAAVAPPTTFARAALLALAVALPSFPGGEADGEPSPPPAQCDLEKPDAQKGMKCPRCNPLCGLNRWSDAKGCYVPFHRKTTDGQRCPCAGNHGGARGARAGCKRDSAGSCSAPGPAPKARRAAPDTVEHDPDDDRLERALQDDALLSDFLAPESSTNPDKYDQAKFTAHSARLPAPLMEAGARVAAKHDLRNKALWGSFLFFAATLIRMQPPELLRQGARERLAAVVLQRHEDDVLAGKYVTTMLDVGWRSRSKEAAQLYRRFFARKPLSEETLGPWCFALCVFRYPGTMAFVEAALRGYSEPEVAAAFGKDIAADDAESLLRLFTEGLQLEFTLRTSITAAFDPHDGRRQVYREECDRAAPDDKRGDHMLKAMRQWYQQAPAMATAIMAAHRALAALDWPALDAACLALMGEILDLELLGRAFADPLLSVQERSSCYHGKFILDSIYWLLGSSCCTASGNLAPGYPAQGMKPRCSCDSCRLLFRAREKHMFIGPALRELLISLHCPARGAKAGLARGVLELAQALLPDFNAMFQCELDLYALQFLPCIWGKWLMATERLGRALPADAPEYLTVLERLRKGVRRGEKERIFELETIRIRELWVGIRQFGFVQEFIAAPALKQRRICDHVVWNAPGTRKFVSEILGIGRGPS